jgi:xanthine/CO dehydrogenase XdhC/CoxF family maturation factor
MMERRRIVELWQRGDAAALATLVRVEGSSYRRPGARLIIAQNGEYAGAISGGCLEAEVIRKAVWKVRSGAAVDRYSTMFDDTAEIPYGLGCGGTVDLLLEPADTPEFTALMEALAATLHGERRRVVTRLPQDGSIQRLILDDDAKKLFRSPGFGEGEIFDEILDPPQRLILFGAGDDAQPMVTAAAMMGWRVVVVDGRPQWARAERFPQAESVTRSFAAAEISSADAVILMTHSYEQDRDFLAAVLPRRPRYLGLLGARHRSALLMHEAATALGTDLQHVCDQVWAPLGLDLGGDGAEAIALAAIAEVQAAITGKLPTMRRMTARDVEEQAAAGNASRYLQAPCSI